MTDPVDDLKARSSKVWNQTCEEYAPRLYGFIFHLVRRNQRLAEELHQETWLSAIEGIAGFDPNRGEFSGWLFSIARNVIATHWRRVSQRSHDQTVDDLPDDSVCSRDVPLPVEIMEQLERAEVVRATLLELGDDQRQALIQKYVECLPIEAAQRMNRSPKAVESLLTRSRDKLRALLRRYFPLATEGEMR